jgi:hypothetical protein
MLKSRLPELISALEAIQSTTLVLGVSAQPRGSHVGKTEARGAAVAALEAHALATIPGSTSFRVTWSECFFLFRHDGGDWSGVFAELAQNVRSGDVELLLAWVTISDPRSASWFDEFFGEFSVRSHFGSCRWIEGRLVE